MKAEEAIQKLHLAEKEVPDNTIDLIPIKRRVQRWAAQNAYTLVFLSVMFFITWTILVVAIVSKWVGGS